MVPSFQGPLEQPPHVAKGTQEFMGTPGLDGVLIWRFLGSSNYCDFVYNQMVPPSITRVTI